MAPVQEGALKRLSAALEGRDHCMATDIGQYQMSAARFLSFDGPKPVLLDCLVANLANCFPMARPPCVEDRPGISRVTLATRIEGQSPQGPGRT